MLLALARLAAGSAAAQQVTLERPDLPWHFGVLDTPSVNAFAAPVEGARALQQQEEGGTTIPSGGRPLPGGGSGILRGIFGR